MKAHTLEIYFTSIFLLISLFSIMLYIYSFSRKRQSYLLYFSLFLGAMAVNLAAVWQIWPEFTAASVSKYVSYGASTFFLLFYEQIFGSGFKKVNTRLWQVHLISWMLIIFLSLFSFIRLEESFFPYSLLNIVTVVLIAIETIYKANSGNRDAKIFTFGLLTLVATLIFDISQAIKIGGYAPSQTTTWGLLLFCLCLTFVLLKRYIEIGPDFFKETLTFDTDPLELKIQAGSMVMHTFKNEIHRLMYLNERNKNLLASLDGEVKTDFSYQIDSMDESLAHMNDMLAAVKKTDDIDLNPIILTLDSIITDAVETIRPELLDSRIEVQLNLSPGLKLEADPLHMKECILNLLSNSMEAIQHSAGWIKLNLYKARNEIILEVADNGKGIPRENIKDVITPLFTTKKGSSHQGIGMYYSYFVVTKHGGTLAIPYSEVDKGTVIQIRLPRKNSHRRLWRFGTLGKNKTHAG
ncbi:hypothetical protein CVD28_07365 [Bacillus sp. M6-12]|uniref:sensor histidine kinase n=1 Tax=Bacillus sp. M6-12 TaxID=2054166 RepID=UPI000C758BE5|nr:sensor histidine kinase [Bacillus sp. M6-12]PLS18471.1 hypothetical protein CVD28_07365 [Bacillus sp. M6-12]